MCLRSRWHIKIPWRNDSLACVWFRDLSDDNCIFTDCKSFTLIPHSQESQVFPLTILSPINFCSVLDLFNRLKNRSSFPFLRTSLGTSLYLRSTPSYLPPDLSISSLHIHSYAPLSWYLTSQTSWFPVLLSSPLSSQTPYPHLHHVHVEHLSIVVADNLLKRQNLATELPMGP